MVAQATQLSIEKLWPVGEDHVLRPLKQPQGPKCPLTGEWISKMWSIHTTNIIQPQKRRKF